MTQIECLPLCGEQTILRRFRESDLTAFQAYRTDPQVGQYQSWTAQSDNEALRFITAVATCPLFQPGEWCQIAVATPDDKLIGDIGVCVDPTSQTAELGVSVALTAQGHGLAFDACKSACGLIFDQTPVQRIIAISLVENTNAHALASRLGFIYQETTETVEDGTTFIEKVFHLERDGKR